MAGKTPNAWGLFDMAGNVMEWAWDCWVADYHGGLSDPHTDPLNGHESCVNGSTRRGGSYASTAGGARAAVRAKEPYGTKFPRLGFRVARTIH